MLRLVYVDNSRNTFIVQFRAPAESESGHWGWRLSRDHRPDDEAEEERINDAGGFIARGRYFT